jgi:alpha-L-fucosidase
VMLNVGPMGTGRFSPEDRKLLEGIGQWMKVNGEAIYAAERTPLPVQPWGTSSLKGDDLYLSVFDMPPQGSLIIGDLQSDPKQAVLLGSSAHALRVHRLDPDHVEIKLPAEARAAVIPVIKLTFDGPIRSGGALPVSPIQPNHYRIFDARLAGGIGYGSNTYARAGSTDWTQRDGRIWWPVLARRAGSYEVSVTYNRVKGIGGGEYTVNIDGQSLKQSVEAGELTPDLHKGDIVTRDLGTLTVPAGRHELSINAANIPAGQELMHFIGVTLTPVAR